MYRLDETQQALVEKVALLADEKIAPYADEVDAQGRFPKEAVNALAQSGFLGLIVPEEYGGQGQGLRVMAAVLEQIAQRCASTAMIYLMHLSGTASYVTHLQKQPDHALSQDTLRAIGRGEHLTTLAWSEKGSRSHFWSPVSQAALAGGQTQVSAKKSWVTAAGYADSYVVTTRTAEVSDPMDVTLYAVYKNDKGLSVSGPWNSLGMRGNASAPMELESLALTPQRALNEAGDGFRRMMEDIAPWFLLGNSAVSIGISEAAVQSTIKHLTAGRFEYNNSSLADLPNLRERLARMRITTDAARAHLVTVLDAVESGDASANLLVLASKASAGEAALAVTDLAMKACGGAAFSRHLSVERNFRDARAASVMAPTSDVLHDFIGRALCGLPLF
jgi:alkylation response protein AidB-like acyl-CoA dehydrogenase